MKFQVQFISSIIYLLLMVNFAWSQNSTIKSHAAYSKTRGNPNKFRTESGKNISFAEMDEFLKIQMDSIGIPGLSFAIINGKQIIYHRTLGVTNIDTKQKVTNETLFDGASMTKTPFAFLVMRLAEKGVLELDTPLYTYLPHPDIAHDDRYKLITARMALSHTTGFPNWRFFNKDGKLDIKFTPGTQFQYSGEGFEYLANVVAHLMKIPKNELQQVFNAEVAKPLKMRYTYFTWNDSVAKYRAMGHVDGKVADGYGIKAERPNFYAAYSLQSEAVNYAKFLIGMMNGALLKKESYEDMLKIQFPDATNADKNQRGLGIVITPTAYGTQYSHGGFNLNFSCDFMFNKNQKFGYVFFTNCKALLHE